MITTDTENEAVKEDKVEEKNKNNVPDNSEDEKVYYTSLFFSTFSLSFVILFCFYFYSRRVFMVQLFILLCFSDYQPIQEKKRKRIAIQDSPGTGIARSRRSVKVTFHSFNC
jgi:hypothetical protein